MVHSLSDVGHRNRRKRGKKAASTECLAGNWSTNGCSNKVQVREQVTFTIPSSSSQLLPDGFEERAYHLIAKEMAYHPRTDYLFSETVCEEKVDAGMRDEAIFNLRFLHKFHNLSPDCFAHAVNITDRFLAKVKVKPKYMACLATAAYLIAAKMIEERENWPTPRKLVSMARCGGSPGDLERMEAIIRVKLRDGGGGGGGAGDKAAEAAGSLEFAVTPFHFLLLLEPLFQCTKSFQSAVGDLETCLCSVAMYSFRPALLAVCIARRYLEDCPAPVLDRVLQLMELTAADLPPCESSLEAESRRCRSRPPVSRRLLLASWPGASRLRSRSRSVPAPRGSGSSWVVANSSYSSLGCCAPLDPIKEEWLEEDGWGGYRLFD